jgi:hypothetical protein
MTLPNLGTVIVRRLLFRKIIVLGYYFTKFPDQPRILGDMEVETKRRLTENLARLENETRKRNMLMIINIQYK